MTIAMTTRDTLERLAEEFEYLAMTEADAVAAASSKRWASTKKREGKADAWKFAAFRLRECAKGEE